MTAEAVETAEVGIVPDLAPQPPARTETPAPVVGVADLDSWIQVAGSIFQLAEKISRTPFVPKDLRDPAACAAAMLTGRELGVPPMTAAAHIHVVNGRAGMSAQLMRALILAKGHDFDYSIVSPEIVTVRVRRRGGSDADWREVSYTAAEAIKAGQGLMKVYPQDKLVARATSRAARMFFADVIGGMLYTPEELAEIPATRPAPQPAPRPVDTSGVRNALGAQLAERAEPQPENPDLVSRAQLTKIHAQLTELGLGGDRDLRREQCAEIIGRPLSSGTEMTREEASRVITHLDTHGLRPAPQPAEETT